MSRNGRNKEYLRYRPKRNGLVVQQFLNASSMSIDSMGGAAGIVVPTQVVPPALTEEQCTFICGEQPEYITRHIEPAYFDAALEGYFQFGTLHRYRAQEGTVVGRLGDHQESRIEEIFNSRKNYFEKLRIGGARLTNVEIIGCEKQVVHELIANDYCSCSSIGHFDIARAKSICEWEADEAKRPKKYVTYHLPTLKEAILEENSIQRNGHKSLICRKVIYGNKDRVWDVESSFEYKPSKDHLNIWLSIAFIKSKRFEHEQEFRMLLIDKAKPGCLQQSTDKFVIQNSRHIASAIVECGDF